VLKLSAGGGAGGGECHAQKDDTPVKASIPFSEIFPPSPLLFRSLFFFLIINLITINYNFKLCQLIVKNNIYIMNL